ncbi:MAG: extracellular solute-binding protein [Pseudomonadota bacterium]
MTHSSNTTRSLFTALATATSLALVAPASAQEATTTAPAVTEADTGAKTPDRTWHHALSLVGKPAMPEGFTSFPWVNPDAPKGGAIRRAQIGSFDSLNAFSFKGDRAGGIALIYESLMTSSLDEPSTEYGLIAEAVSHPDDYSSATFRLRPQARFHDGKPITIDDVIFSLEAIKSAHPFWNSYYKNVTSAEKTGENEVTFRFDQKGNRELPHIMGQLYIIPKHFWTANGPDGKPRDITKSSLEVPLGSGPYRISKVDAGRSLTFERVKDYWAKDLPVNRGQYNIDTITDEYYRDSTVAFEAFKAGRIDFRYENTSKIWATGYDFPAVKNGLVKREEVTLENPSGMQAFVFNSRRPALKDPRVRRAMNLAFDFEWTNKNLFSSLYQRTGSFFENSELASSGLPTGLELEILETVRADVPPAVFKEEYRNPSTDNGGSLRANMKKATELLDEAGFKIQQEAIADPDCGFVCGLMKSVGLKSDKTKRVLRGPDGKPLKVEIMLVSPLFERIALPWIENLKRLGIDAGARVYDSPQYVRRLQTFDFDIVSSRFGQSESPGNEQRDFWGSESADKDGGRNIAGIKNPAVDKLINRIIFAKDREELIAATRALDRVLLHGHYVVPQWFNPESWIAYWDKFSHPTTLPSRSIGFPSVWWHDDTKAKKLAEAKK